MGNKASIFRSRILTKLHEPTVGSTSFVSIRSDYRVITQHNTVRLTMIWAVVYFFFETIQFDLYDLTYRIQSTHLLVLLVKVVGPKPDQPDCTTACCGHVFNMLKILTQFDFCVQNLTIQNQSHTAKPHPCIFFLVYTAQ